MQKKLFRYSLKIKGISVFILISDVQDDFLYVYKLVTVIIETFIFKQYTLEERDPVPLSIHHMPICVSFAFFQQG